MASYLNIDKSAFRWGEYVGYCNGAQRIRRCGYGWETYSLGSSSGTFTPLRARTLRELSRKISDANCIPARSEGGR